MTKTTRRPSSRDKILETATALVAEHGVQQLTIEATAAAAGVTKAGLIYHFKTRDDLLTAVVENMAREIDVHSHAVEAQLGAQAKRAAGRVRSELQLLLREQLEMTFNMPPQLQRLMRSLLEAYSSNPRVLPPVQALFERSYAAIGNSNDSGRALLVSLALDGVLLIDLLQLHQFTPEQRKSIRTAVEDLVTQIP
ncbi:TetR/AcrR family transcriptional regulator [Comamonas thiooxydans]|uniref:TetR/AcrR family transcriptional regulator n=1 Tax=Comamonas thiooxydans TaxID=363952 RepID=A0AA42Q0N0_9BURK|nr:TetR/AcrR family transcriptional regulator [Comamonas thiooxydans]MDH1334614.1 TetR/AcrR family transcriptional regulator [Comamonas thiooxydans]MDH1740941.1 TetR/AcrR family transcriptional regulator [Comamonas thiooxydans]MDH1787134.1 TetR/AcrR family transcriptional regulator [Comamonas thiooxydans]